MSRMNSWVPKNTNTEHWEEKSDSLENLLSPLPPSPGSSYQASCGWRITSKYDVPLVNSFSCLGFDLMSIFTTSLSRTNGSAATALSTLMTILTSMVYYDQMTRFEEVAEDVFLTYFEPTLFPQSSRGYLAVRVVTIIHCLLVCLVCLAFITRTRYTQLGNHWQSTSRKSFHQQHRASLRVPPAPPTSK